MIVGLDIGNLTTVCVSENNEVIFESRLKLYQQINNFSDNDVFEIDSQKFIFEEGYFENNLIKHEKENFINLVYYAIAKTCDSNSIYLTIGVPAGQYNTEKENIRKIIMQNSCKTVKLNGKMRAITIEDVFVAPEGYGIKVEALTDINNNSKTLVIDIGGGTTDIAEFNEKGKFVGGKSIKTGLLDLYKDIADILDTKYRLDVSVEDARKYFDGELSVKNERFEEETEYKKEALLSLGKYLINELRGLYSSNLSQYNIVLSGGGAKSLHPLFLKVYPQTKSIVDITANAKGFRKVGIAKWQKN
jgi:plasmid segregation protein ParM